ncbi:MAG: RNA polymerase factor sigma-54 [Bacteroidetes bacterium]|nr:RNA polymerase factor sigma-54 [Bacteroidota bacterium]
MGKNTLTTKTSLKHTILPQQMQLLKILQLPTTALEAAIKQEIDENPFLEEFNDELDTVLEQTIDINAPAPDQIKELSSDYKKNLNNNNLDDNSNKHIYDDDFVPIEDEEDSYDYYDEQWEDDDDFTPNSLTDSDKDYESFQIKSETTLFDSLAEQINILNLNTVDKIIALYIAGNLEDDGYLRINNKDMLLEVNSLIAEHNYNIQKAQYELKNQITENKNINPAKLYELNPQSVDTLLDIANNYQDIAKEVNPQNIKSKNENKILESVTIKDIEKNIKIVQTLEPIGIASRDLRECLIAQLKAKARLNENVKVALIIVTDYFEEFSMKHFNPIKTKLGITEQKIVAAIDEIKKLNPKPGIGNYVNENITIIPDFIVNYDHKNDDFLIVLNDANIPILKVSPTYQKMLEEAKNSKNYNRSTREWMKERLEKAKNFVNAIEQRKISMLMIMTAIVQRQRDFFLNDWSNLKPLKYQDITDDTTFDVSTVCRVVNDKYVQTSTGIYELKFFFSEALTMDDGAAISTKVIRNRLKEIIISEPKNKPYSDEKLTEILNKEGYNVARRTVAKYRETLKYPVARLRREL